MKRFRWAALVLVSILALVASNLFVSPLGSAPITRAPIDGPFRLAAQSKIDGAFRSVTSRRNINDASVDWQADMPSGLQARRGASYPWSTTSHGDELWMGTITNGWCMWPTVNLKWPLTLSTYQSQFTGCSLQDTLAGRPQVIVLNFETGTQEIVDETWLQHGGEDYKRAIERDPDMSRWSVMGLRAAGTIGDLVFFAGHHTHAGAAGWLRIYAFNARTRSFLGYRELRGDTTRHFKIITDENGAPGFYTIIGAETGMLQNGEGPTVMLRWVGTEEAPFEGGNYLQTDDGTGAGWDIVSTEALDNHYGMIGDFEQFTHHDGSERLIMSSAAHPLLYDPETGKRDPSRNESIMLLTEPVPAGGWTRDTPMTFAPVFGMDRYDPDVRGRWGAKWGTTNIHEGYIYFGTYHQGTEAGYSHFRKADRRLYDTLTATRESHLAFLSNQWRATSIFRMRLEDIDAIAKGEKDPELLYGYERFQIVDEAGNWTAAPNGLGQTPAFGPAGMGNPGNIYSWASLSHDGQLFWGFFDAFTGTHDLLSEADAGRLLITPGISLPMPGWRARRDKGLTRALHDWAKQEMSTAGLGKDFVPGGDLVVFERGEPARSLTKTGFGNPCANGVRNIEQLNDRVLFATSTWCNLSNLAGFEIYEYVSELDSED